MTRPGLEVRKRILRLVRSFPGLHLRELARQAGLSEALAGYHLKAMEQQGLVLVEEDGAYRRYYPAEAEAPDERDRRMMAVLRQRVPLQIVLILMEQGPMKHGPLTGRLGLAKSTVSYHLRKLAAAGVVADEPEGGLDLVDVSRVERLLTRWEPPPSLVDRFSRLWGRFYAAHHRRPKD